jgi:hypothetical protein
MTPQATLELDTAVVECGGAVLGTAGWTGNDRHHWFGVVLRYRTQGRGEVDVGAAGHQDFDRNEHGQVRFRLDVPLAGPVTYHGQLLRLTWQVELLGLSTKRDRKKVSPVVADLTVVPFGWTRLPAAPWGSPGWPRSHP